MLALSDNARGMGPLPSICPTKRCNSIPIDWVQPPDELMAKASVSQNDTSAGEGVRDIQK